MDQEKIGKKIKSLRDRLNLSQGEFGEKYGVSAQAVSKWERGLCLPDIYLLKQIGKDFDISLEELLDGEEENKKKVKSRKMIYNLIFVCIILIIGILGFVLSQRNNEFEFKTLTTTCDDFNIYGVVAYNKNKSSIYISNINYCGGNDNNLYKKIDCSLYEIHENVRTVISNFNSTKEMKLEEFLKDVSFKIDNYDKMCKDYSKENLFLEIKATLKNEQIITYEIPLSLDSSCGCEE